MSDRLREIYDRCDVSNNAVDGMSFEEFKQAIEAEADKARRGAIQKVAKSAKPDKRSLPKGDLTSVGLQVRFKAQGYNQAIDQYEQNIKELLGGSSE